MKRETESVQGKNLVLTNFNPPDSKSGKRRSFTLWPRLYDRESWNQRGFHFSLLVRDKVEIVGRIKPFNRKWYTWHVIPFFSSPSVVGPTQKETTEQTDKVILRFFYLTFCLLRCLYYTERVNFQKKKKNGERHGRDCHQEIEQEQFRS